MPIFTGSDPMPTLNRAPNEKELEYLIRLFLRAETSIINEIGRLRSQGLVDYHAVAALERVQKILRKLESDCWEYVSKMIEKQFYVRVPEALFLLRTANKYGKIIAKRLSGSFVCRSNDDRHSANAEPRNVPLCSSRK